MTESSGAQTRLAWPPTKADVLAVVLTGCLIVTLLGGAWWPAVVLAVLLTATVLSPRAVQARAEGPGIVVQAEFELEDEVSPTEPEDPPSSTHSPDPPTRPARRRPRNRRPAAG
jgi:hypothetical protein